jgi:glycolate oxidase FAD binding subunit
VVLARYAGAVAAVARQFDLAAGRCAELWPAAPAESLAGDQEAALWQGIAGFAAAGNPGLLVRAGGRPSELAATAAALSRPAERRGWPCTLLLYPGVGLAYGRWAAADTTAVADALAQARRSLAVAGGYVVVEDSPAALRPNLDLWGPAPPTLPLMQSLKAQWDANRVLSPGRYVGGI